MSRMEELMFLDHEGASLDEPHGIVPDGLDEPWVGMSRHQLWGVDDTFRQLVEAVHFGRDACEAKGTQGTADELIAGDLARELLNLRDSRPGGTSAVLSSGGERPRILMGATIKIAHDL